MPHWSCRSFLAQLQRFAPVHYSVLSGIQASRCLFVCHINVHQKFSKMPLPSLCLTFAEVVNVCVNYNSAAEDRVGAREWDLQVGKPRHAEQTTSEPSKEPTGGTTATSRKELMKKLFEKCHAHFGAGGLRLLVLLTCLSVMENSAMPGKMV